jgi:hypothetical protein
MCPLCLTTLVVTVATTTGAGAAVTALAVRISRSLRKTEEQLPETTKGTTP